MIRSRLTINRAVTITKLVGILGVNAHNYHTVVSIEEDMITISISKQDHNRVFLTLPHVPRLAKAPASVRSLLWQFVDDKEGLVAHALQTQAWGKIGTVVVVAANKHSKLLLFFVSLCTCTTC